MHSKKIVHRGIDDSKVIFDGNQILLTGFTNALSMDNSNFVKRGGFLYAPTTLKLLFQPPEMSKELSDEKIDVWCVGVLAFLMITGSYPFNFDENYNDEINYKDYQKIKLKKAKIPQEVQKFIERCLTLDKNERPSA